MDSSTCLLRKHLANCGSQNPLRLFMSQNPQPNQIIHHNQEMIIFTQAREFLRVSADKFQTERRIRSDLNTLFPDCWLQFSTERDGFTNPVQKSHFFRRQFAQCLDKGRQYRTLRRTRRVGQQCSPFFLQCFIMLPRLLEEKVVGAQQRDLFQLPRASLLRA